MRTVLLLAILFALMPSESRGGDNPCGRPPPGEEWLGWDDELRRLSPDSIPGLPDGIRGWMELRRYTVPQSYCGGRINNVFAASLARQGTEDWAALCSRDDSSRIVVFWKGSADSVTEWEVVSDRAFSYLCQGREYGYSRWITAGRPDTTVDWRPAMLIDHDGVEEWECEKASVIHYWSGGVLHELGGAD